MRGGPSPEYGVSLMTGANVLRNMPEKYEASDIFISKDGEWHTSGIARSPQKILKQFDGAFNALHGKYGEDGGVQTLLETFNIPYTGSSRVPSASTLNKRLAKKILSGAGISMPEHFVLRPEEANPGFLEKVFDEFSHPLVVKPLLGGSSMAVEVVDTPDAFLRAVEAAMEGDSSVMVEEYIEGREASCGVLESSSGLVALHPVEIIIKSPKKYFDYDSKYGPESAKKTCPSDLPVRKKDLIQRLALKAHETLGLKHYSSSDFIIHPKRGIFLIEVNALPGLTQYSLYPRELSAAGINLSDFIDHTLSLAFR